MFKKLIALTLTVLMVFCVFTGCSNDNTTTEDDNILTEDNTTQSEYKDGIYRAQIEDYDSDGWQDYVQIVIEDGMITSVDYESLNQEGLKRSEDTAYNDAMKAEYGMTGSEIYKGYSDALVTGGNIESITEINNTTDSFNYFLELATAALEQAKKGDTAVITIPRPSK